METMYNNNGGYYGQQNMGGYYDPTAMYAGNYNAYTPQPVQAPQNVNALTNEEIQSLKASRPSNAIDINVTNDDVLRSMCTHKYNGRDVVQSLNDGSGDVWCPICNERWNQSTLEKEELQSLIDKLISQMQNAKWIGDLPVNVAREYFQIIPLLKKYPEVQRYAMSNFNKYFNQNPYGNVQDASIYGIYNSLFGPNYNAYTQPVYCAQPAYQYPYQPNVNIQAPVVNPCVNPMQAQTIPYGMNQAAPNQQMNQQANIMMNNQQPPQQMNQAVPNQQPTYQPPAYQPLNTTYQPNSVTPDGSKITNNTDGSTTSEKTIDL